MRLANNEYPCPCCGHMSFSEPPGSYDICPICYWEDDVVQLRWVLRGGGANKPSLVESQQNYAKHGAMEERFVKNVRQPRAGDERDPEWRPVDTERDRPQERDDPPWVKDYTVYYYWRSPAT